MTLMDEIERWFLEEFGVYGFVLTPLLYDPLDFTPYRKVCYHGHLTWVRIPSSLSYDSTQILKDTITSEMCRCYPHLLGRVTFTPIKEIRKFKL